MKKAQITETQWIAELEAQSRPPDNAVLMRDLCKRLGVSPNWMIKQLETMREEWGCGLFPRGGKLYRFVWPKTADAIESLRKAYARARSLRV